MANDVRLIAERFDAPEVLALVTAQQVELADQYGFPDPDPDNLDASHFTVERGGYFWLAWRGGDAVACGGIRRHDPTSGEVKRMYTVPHERRKGIGRAIVGLIEEKAHEYGYTRLVLETGTQQRDAIGLYLKLGFEQIECYGVYKEFELSRCYAKTL